MLAWLLSPQCCDFAADRTAIFQPAFILSMTALATLTVTCRPADSAKNTGRCEGCLENHVFLRRGMVFVRNLRGLKNADGSTC
jgi:hypothetical protein